MLNSIYNLKSVDVTEVRDRNDLLLELHLSTNHKNLMIRLTYTTDYTNVPDLYVIETIDRRTGKILAQEYVSQDLYWALRHSSRSSSSLQSGLGKMGNIVKPVFSEIGVPMDIQHLTNPRGGALCRAMFL